MVATRSPASAARATVVRAVVDQQVDVDLRQRATLSMEQYSSSNSRPMLRSHRSVASVRALAAVARDVDEVTLGVPAVDRLDGAGYGRPARIAARSGSRRCTSRSCSSAQPRDPPGELLLVGQLDAEASLAGVREDVPVVVEGRVDVDRDAHRAVRGYRRAMAHRSAVRASVSRRAYGPVGPQRVAGRGLARAPALGDRRGRPVNVIEIGPGARGSATGTIVWIHGLSGSWQNWLENLPALRADASLHRHGPPGLRGLADARGEDLDHRLRGDRSTSSCARSACARATSSATRWAGSSAPRSRSASRPWVDRLVLVSAAGLSIEYQRTIGPHARVIAARRAARWARAGWPRKLRLRWRDARGPGARSSDRRRAPRAGCPRRSSPSSCAARASRGSSTRWMR